MPLIVVSSWKLSKVPPRIASAVSVAGDAPGFGHIGLQLLGVRRIDVELAAPGPVGDVGDDVTGDRRRCRGGCRSPRSSPSADRRRPPPTRRRARAAAGRRASPVIFVSISGYRYEPPSVIGASMAPCTSSMMSAIGNPSVAALRAAVATSVTCACAGPFIVLSVAAPGLMRPFILPSNRKPGKRVVVIEAIVVADDRRVDGAGHRHRAARARSRASDCESRICAARRTRTCRCRRTWRRSPADRHRPCAARLANRGRSIPRSRC